MLYIVVNMRCVNFAHRFLLVQWTWGTVSFYCFCFLSAPLHWHSFHYQATLLGSDWLSNHAWINVISIPYEQCFKCTDISIGSRKHGHTAVRGAPVPVSSHLLWASCNAIPLTETPSTTELRLSFSIVLHTYVNCVPVLENTRLHLVIWCPACFSHPTIATVL